MLNYPAESVQPIRTSDDKRIQLLQELIKAVAWQGYRFTTVTPCTHERFLARSDGIAKNMRDVFGWSLPFDAGVLSPLILDLLQQADLLMQCGARWRSKVRISSLGEDLFLHSYFPTDETDAVFFGPDTYRFARFIQQSLNILQVQSGLPAHQRPLRVLDVGCGSGAGGVAAIRALPIRQAFELNLNDVNPVALEYADACTRAADLPATLWPGDFFTIQGAEFDVIVSNPPYISDPAGRLYRDGGSRMGLDLSLRIVRHALPLLAPGGRMLLYTGVAMKTGENDPLLSELSPLREDDRFRWSYEEIDPDIFGEELERPGYADAHRIAAVGLAVVRVH